MVPHLPLMGHMRLARVADLPRISLVAAAGFFHSPVFQYQRVFYADFPSSTVASYHSQYLSEILDPNAVVYVAEDEYDPSESGHTYEALRNISTDIWQPPASGKVIVGVASITFAPDSSRKGQFQPDGNNLDLPPRIGTDDGLDLSSEGVKRYAETNSLPKKKWLAGRMRFQTLAVHPAYWRRGHGNALTKWCSDIADTDNVAVGVSAAKMSVGILKRHDYELKEDVLIQGYEHHKEDIHLWIGIREPQTQVLASEL